MVCLSISNNCKMLVLPELLLPNNAVMGASCITPVLRQDRKLWMSMRVIMKGPLFTERTCNLQEARLGCAGTRGVSGDVIRGAVILPQVAAFRERLNARGRASAASTRSGSNSLGPILRGRRAGAPDRSTPDNLVGASRAPGRWPPGPRVCWRLDPCR